MRKLKSLFTVFAGALLSFAARPARAQYLGTTSPQTVQATLASNLACTGAAQNFTTGITPKFQNLGQTQHYAYITSSGVTNLLMQIQGLDPAGAVTVISDTGSSGTALSGTNSALVGSGYFTNIRVVVTCLPAATGTFTLNYTGTSGTPNNIAGSYQLAQLDKVISSAASAGASFSTPFFTTPFGNSQGVLFFEFNGAGPAGSSINVTCQDQNGINTGLQSWALATTTAVAQIFDVPPGVCPTIDVGYQSGGASASTYYLDYVLLPPGTSLPSFYTHITGTGATVVKSGPGMVHTLVVGTPAAGTISLFDLVPGSCTGTPATNVVSVITATATFPSAPEIYDIVFNNGICVKASAAMDITVNAQ